MSGRAVPDWALTALNAAPGAQSELPDASTGPPLDWQPEWLASVPAEADARHWRLSLAGEATLGRRRLAAVVEASRSRALPGHWVWRVRRFPCDAFADEAARCFAALADAATHTARVLRCRVHLFALDEECLRRCAAAAAAAGFRRAPPESYGHTVLLDLRGTEAELLQRLAGNARRDIRKISATPFEVRAVTESRFAPRLTALEAETKARTGGQYGTQIWSGWLAFAQAHPEDARISGLFRPGGREPGDLVGFALGCRHGDLVEYRAAATARVSDARVPLAYGPAWDLMRWARSVGAVRFDFGGVVASQDERSDPQARISRFKRNFSKSVSRVSEEWVLEARPIRSRLAHAASRVARRLISDSPTPNKPHKSS